LYKDFCIIGRKVSKRDRFGVYADAHASVLRCLSLSLKSAFTEQTKKSAFLHDLIFELETAKRLIRICHEIGAIEDGVYFSFQDKVIEVSKMCNGWLAYTKRKEPS
jgi:hypothetical protein